MDVSVRRKCFRFILFAIVISVICLIGLIFLVDEDISPRKLVALVYPNTSTSITDLVKYASLKMKFSSLRRINSASTVQEAITRIITILDYMKEIPYNNRLLNAFEKLSNSLEQIFTQVKNISINNEGTQPLSFSVGAGNDTEKRVISIGLYGSNPKYTVGAIRNSELVKYIYPGWIIRFYVDDTVPKDVIEKLIENDAEVIHVDKRQGLDGGIAGMFWRFLVADDPTVDRFVIRDADSRLNMRERMAVEEWIKSGKMVHIMRDHVNHRYKMNGGMWGARKGAIKNMTALIKEWAQTQKLNNYIGDMTFLATKIYPNIENSLIAHDSFYCERFPSSTSFPTRR